MTDEKTELAHKLADSVEEAMDELRVAGNEGALAHLAWAVGGLAGAMLQKPQDEITLWAGRVVAAASICCVEGDSALDDLRAAALASHHPADPIHAPDDISFDDVALEVEAASTPGLDT